MEFGTRFPQTFEDRDGKKEIAERPLVENDYPHLFIGLSSHTLLRRRSRVKHGDKRT